jgi:2-oxopent-4-enoate/cis-2-oxohex-4-enoate hydratase
MDNTIIESCAGQLHEALRTRKAMEPLTGRYPGMRVEDAYRIQQSLVARRLQGGARVIGKKIGVTSRPVMDMLGVYEPDFGILLDDMPVADGGTVDTRMLIQPRVEGEIAFVLKRDLSGPGVRASDVLAAAEYVMPCFEIVDSRIRDWKIKIQDTVADNASCGLYVLGKNRVDPRGADLYSCGMVMQKGGEVIATGAGAAALGSPLNSVAWLANRFSELGDGLKAGEVVLSGALAAMFPAKAGDDFNLTIAGLGDCSVHFR